MTAGERLARDPSASYEAWSQAILDEVLPEQPAGTSVVFCCDLDAIVAAGTALGVPADACTRVFATTVERRYHLAARGSIEGVRGDTVRFRSGDERSVRVPPFLGVCAVMVLAASRMTTDAGMAAGNYYDRLWETLGRAPGCGSPYEFDYAPFLFRYLAEWMERDLGGSRGRLLLAEGGYPHVGSAINQCIFREHDHGHLADFFVRRLRASDANVDLLRLLEISPERHDLTRRAQQALAEPGLRPLADAALRRALARWDGTTPDHAGGRSWPGRLHLAVNRRLGLSLSAPDAPDGLELGDSAILGDRPIAIALTDLDDVADRGLRLGVPGSRGVFLPAAGDTLVFEVSEDAGLVWSRAPSADRVYVLSRDSGVQRALFEYAARSSLARTLPAGWRLYERVRVEALPAAANVAAAAAARPAVALVGGLRIAPGAWLTGYPPRLQLGDVDHQLRVLVDGVDEGVIAGGQERRLELAAGDHRVDVGDGLVSYAVHMVERHPARPLYGALRCPVDAHGQSAGATADPADPSVCGAIFSAAYTGPLPLLLRAREVTEISRTGSAARVHAPPPAAWLAAVGLDPRAARWELAISADSAWVLTSGGAIAIDPVVPEQLDDAATTAVRALGARVRARAHDRADPDQTADAFAQLIVLAAAQEPAL